MVKEKDENEERNIVHLLTKTSHVYIYLYSSSILIEWDTVLCGCRRHVLVEGENVIWCTTASFILNKCILKIIICSHKIRWHRQSFMFSLTSFCLFLFWLRKTSAWKRPSKWNSHKGSRCHVNKCICLTESKICYPLRMG